MNEVTPNQSNTYGVATCFSIASVPAVIVWYAIRGLPLNLDIVVALVVLAFIASALFKSGEESGDVKVQFVGVHKVLGFITGKLYTMGKHFLIPGIETLDIVDLHEKKLAPPEFEELARDRVPIKVDGFFLAQVKDPIKYLKGVSKPDESLKKLFETQIRLFVSQWNKASDLIVQKDLLGDFLELTCDDTDAILELQGRLVSLTLPGNGPALNEESVMNIMEQRGKFCASAAKWGFIITDIHVENVDLPDHLKAAAEARAAESDVMAQQEVRHKTLVRMSKKSVKELGVTGREALNHSSMLVGLPVKRTITEIDVPEGLVAAGKDLALSLAGILQKNGDGK